MREKGDAGQVMRLAQGLGWFSIGLGLAELLAPGGVANITGIPKRRGLVRLMGCREIASGLAIFSQQRPANGLWSRVMGDAMDLAVLGTALFSPKSERGKLVAALAAVGGVTALDVYASREVSRNPVAKFHAERAEYSIIIDRSPEELYSFWHNFENLPQFMTHLHSVEVKDEKRSHWVAKGPAGTSVEWDAEIINEHPNELLAWRSVVGSDVDNSGTVRFERAPGGRGTLVRVKIEYRPPVGPLGALVAKVFGQDPEKQVAVDLHRFKQLMETGEIIRTEGQPAGRSRSLSRKFDELVRK